MKKLLSISFLLVYLTVVCGVTLKLHYCGGHLASLKVSFAGDHPKCKCGNRKMKKDCCKDKTVHLQFKADQKTQKYLVLENNDFKVAAESFPVLSLDLLSIYNIPERGEVAHPPPPLPSSSPVYLLNRVFRI